MIFLSEMPRLPACLLALIVTCSTKSSHAEAKPGKRPRGVLAKYARLVSSASLGAVTD